MGISYKISQRLIVLGTQRTITLAIASLITLAIAPLISSISSIPALATSCNMC